MQSPQLEKIRPYSESNSAGAQYGAQREWVLWLHKMLPNVEQLLLYKVNPNQTISQCALNPAGPEPDEAVINAVLSCVHRQKALYLDLVTQPSQHLLAIPFHHASSNTAYVLIMLTSALNTVQQNTAVQLTQWAAMQLRDDKSTPNQGTKPKLGPEGQIAHALMAALDSDGTFTGLAFTLVNTLASLCGCVRVSLGSFDGKDLKLVAMSGQSRIDDRRTIARQLCALMQETISCQRAMYPNAEDVAAPALQTYFHSQGEHPVLAFVMPGSASEKFVLVLERAVTNPFVDAHANAIEQSVQKVAGLLELSQTSELSLRTKAQRRVRTKLNTLKYVDAWSAKRWVATTAFAVLLLSFFIPVTHRVSANAYIEASDRQVLVAAQDGFILAAHARAGDLVSKGDLLATLDGQTLQLAADKWRSEKSKNQQEYAQALAIHDRAELSRLRADAKRIDAEIALIEQQLRRSEVRAPFNGVLLEGDLTQSLGAPVATGDVLFEIASAEKYRLVLEVADHDIGYIHPNQLAHLRMAALPTSAWDAVLGDVMPVAVSEKGSSAFRVPAIIEGDASALRPGMEGVGKVSVGRRSMFWVYTHRLFDKVRYMGWKAGLL